ncbi:MAG: gluconate 2-dehydrogenase subunit 3 family protein [Sphingomonas sp.]|nr:gluconate 2-dehydrogenase subunit 3 family protein [Sphingomonas sp.]
MDRRLILQGFAALVGNALVAPLAQALVRGGGPGLEVLHPFLTPAERQLLGAFSERIIPTTDTPGAIKAGVPQFIEMMLADWYAPADRKLFVDGLKAHDRRARSVHRRPFARLTPAQQDAIITLAMNKALPGADPGFFEHARQLVITGYYRSEIGATVEQVYLPVPGRYEGAYTYAKVGRVFSG